MSMLHFKSWEQWRVSFDTLFISMDLLLVQLTIKYLQGRFLCVIDLSSPQFTGHFNVHSSTAREDEGRRVHTIKNGLQAGVGTGLCFCPSAVSEWEQGFLGIAFYLASYSECLCTWNSASACTLESISSLSIHNISLWGRACGSRRIEHKAVGNWPNEFNVFMWSIYKQQLRCKKNGMKQLSVITFW